MRNARSVGGVVCFGDNLSVAHNQQAVEQAGGRDTWEGETVRCSNWRSRNEGTAPLLYGEAIEIVCKCNGARKVLTDFR